MSATPDEIIALDDGDDDNDNEATMCSAPRASSEEPPSYYVPVFKPNPQPTTARPHRDHERNYLCQRRNWSKGRYAPQGYTPRAQSVCRSNESHCVDPTAVTVVDQIQGPAGGWVTGVRGRVRVRVREG